MVAMPYILVDIVLGILSLMFFCITSAALLSRYPAASLYLPAPVRARRAFAFLAHGVVLSALSIAAVFLVARLLNTRLFSPFLFDLFFCIGLVNSVVLAFQFMDKRYFLGTPKLQRRLLLGTFSVVMALVPAIAVIVAVVGLFTIR
jgi:hypothetical protein